MKIFSLAFIGILLCIQPLFAKNENVSLLVQSPDGKTVKLIWVLKNWSSEITGFDIKRKEGLEDWVKINSEPILPEISAKGQLSLVESDKAEDSRIKAKLFKMIADKKVMEISHEDYLRRLNGNDTEIHNVLLQMMRDYDLALINGFAYVDHPVERKLDYQYGLFIQGTNTLLASASWNYGEIPDLNMITEIVSKPASSAKGIRLSWNADISKMRSADVAGFNVYRQGIRLNLLPIKGENNNDPSEFTWYDKSASTSTPSQYSISAESIFGIEGTIRPYTYNPAEHTQEYKTPKVKEVTSLGYYFKEGMSIKWSFPPEFEKYIKGFYVEKNNIPGGYKRASAMLDPSTRSFIDQTPSPVSSYITVKIIAEYKDRTMAGSPEQLYIYFPSKVPPVPQNLKVKSIQKENKKIAISLSWDPPIAGDSTTSYYKVYKSDPESSGFKVITPTQQLTKDSYTFFAEHGSASIIKFSVTALGKTNAESAMSDTVSVEVPSLDLPAIDFINGFTNGNRAVLQWKYPEIADLKGFRLYKDKQLIAGEQTLTKDKREFTTEELEKGTTHQFTIIAVSESNIESPVSALVPVVIPSGSKK